MGGKLLIDLETVYGTRVRATRIRECGIEQLYRQHARISQLLLPRYSASFVTASGPT